MSELFDKEVNAQKENLKKFFWGSRKLPQAHEKCAMKMKVEELKKRRARKNVIDGRGEFIRCLWKGHVMDTNEPQVNDS